MAMLAAPGRQVDTQAGIVTGHGQFPPRWQAGQGPAQQQVRAAVETQAGQIQDGVTGVIGHGVYAVAVMAPAAS